MDGVRTVFIDGEIWYCAVDIEARLQLKNIHVNLRGMDSRWKVNIRYGSATRAYIHKKALKQILCKTRSHAAAQLAKEIGMDITEIHVVPPEVEFYKVIDKILPGLKKIRQFQIGGYYVDLYIPKLNLVIEYDEHHHNTSGAQIADIRRQEAIESILKCTVLRMKHGQDIFEFIGQLTTFLLHR